jgi:hypothetical protein
MIRRMQVAKSGQNVKEAKDDTDIVLGAFDGKCYKCRRRVIRPIMAR